MVLKLTDSTINRAVEYWFGTAVQKQSIIIDYGTINNWDTSLVTNMNSLFFSYPSVGLDPIDLSNWNVSNVTDMGQMFNNCSLFNSDLSNWNVSNVTNMEFMFLGCLDFTADLSSWNVSKVTNMSQMLSGTSAPLPSWYVA